jgi:hypothetical protein
MPPVVVTFFLEPFRDLLDGLSGALPRRAVPAMIAAAAGLLVSWWLYVPAHEMLHAFGCLATGGSVDRLELRPEYGAALLQRMFPWVSVGSEYAGRLSGFDTHGRDLTYLATVFAPYLLTVLVGVPLVRWVRSRPAGFASCAWFGVAMPVAFAPFTNILGDYYELGSIVVSRISRGITGSDAADAWRSDDLPLLLWAGREGFGVGDYVGIGLGLVLGVLLAFATYRLGSWFAGLVVRGAPAGPAAGPPETPGID